MCGGRRRGCGSCDERIVVWLGGMNALNVCLRLTTTFVEWAGEKSCELILGLDLCYSSSNMYNKAVMFIEQG